MFWIYLWFGSVIGMFVFCSAVCMHGRAGRPDTAFSELVVWLARLSIVMFIVCIGVFITDYINLYM